MPVAKFLKKAQEIQERRQARAQEPKHEEGGEEGWLVSYADMMTLLCGFFIMLYSMANLDGNKFEKAKESLAKSFKGEYVEPSASGVGRFVTQVLQENGVEQSAVVKSDATGVTVSFDSTLFFDTLSAEVKPEGRAVLDRMIQGLAERQAKEVKSYKVVVEGHTDSRPVVSGVFPSNWELSSARASRVVRLFLDQGFGPQTLTAVGYADTRPQFPSRNPDGAWDEQALAKNRRVVIRILEPSETTLPLQEALAGEDVAGVQGTGARAPGSASGRPEELTGITALGTLDGSMDTRTIAPFSVPAAPAAPAVKPADADSR